MKSYLIALLCLTGFLAKGQTVDIIFPPLMETEDSWDFLSSCVLLNELQSSIPVRIELTVVSSEEGLLYSGVCSDQIITSGPHSFASLGLDISDFQPVFTHLDYDGTFQALRQSNFGDLTVCFTTHIQYEVPLTNKSCQELTTNEWERLSLITPVDGAVIETEDFNYTWTPGVSSDLTDGSYYFKVIEVEAGEEDRYKSSKFQSAQAFYEGYDIPFPIEQNEDLNLHYVTDKAYVWTVALVKPNNDYLWADEIWSFSVEENTVKPFYLIPKSTPEEVHYPLGDDKRLRFIYETRYSNDFIEISFYDLNNKVQLVEPITLLNIKPGKNPIQMDLWRYLKVDTEVVLVTITNSKGRKQYLKVVVPSATPSNPENEE